jgi:hypothetical protein
MITIYPVPPFYKCKSEFAHGQWFSLGTPASSTTKTGRHDIAEILLKVALNTINQINQIKLFTFTGGTGYIVMNQNHDLMITIYPVSPLL